MPHDDLGERTTTPATDDATHPDAGKALDVRAHVERWKRQLLDLSGRSFRPGVDVSVRAGEARRRFEWYSDEELVRAIQVASSVAGATSRDGLAEPSR